MTSSTRRGQGKGTGGKGAVRGAERILGQRSPSSYLGVGAGWILTFHKLAFIKMLNVMCVVTLVAVQKYLTKQLKEVLVWTHGWSMQSLVGEMSWREGRGHIAPAGRKQTEEDWHSAHLFLCNPGFELLSFTPSSHPPARNHHTRLTYSFRFGSGPPFMGWCHTHPERVGLSASVKPFRKHPSRHTHSHSVLLRWF